MITISMMALKQCEGAGWKNSKINTTSCSDNVIATVDKHLTVHEIVNVVHLYSNSKRNDKETPYKVKTFMWENYKSAHSSHAIRCCCCCPGNW